MESLNKKYRNLRARLMRDYYDIEETDEDRLKEDHMPKFVDKKDWEWLVKYLRPKEFQKKSKRNIKNHSCLDFGHTAGSKSFYKREKVMPSLLDVYEESHSMSDKLPITQMANNALGFLNNETQEKLVWLMKKSMLKLNLGSMQQLGCHTGVSPSITSLFGRFSECEKL
ncbi:Autonomous transposable element EN-1 mosaic protein [Bienertia sinuspersici]